LIPKNPVPLVQLPKMECSEREVFSEEDIQKLLDKAPDVEWQTIILLGYHAGMRLSDCVALKWENIDPEQGAIVYTQKKTGKKLIVPIEPVLLKHLTYLAKFGTAGFISPKLATKGPGGKHGLSESFKRIATKAGVDLMSGPGKGVRNFCRRTFHSLRHTFISRLANLGVSQQLTMALAGHSTAAMNSKYTHFEFDTLKKAISVLSTGKKPA
jgi:integrase